MDERWIDLFRRHRVGVGLSLDGPARIHDAHRTTRSGGGTHHRVMRAVELLNDSRLEYHVICVLTSAAMDAADEMHAFFRGAGIHRVGFNVEEIEGAHSTSSLAGSEMEETFREFLFRMLDLTKSHGTPQIRELTTARNLILDRGFDAQNNQQTVPLRIVSVGADGKISTFSPELLGNRSRAYGDFSFGNVATHELDDVLGEGNFETVSPRNSIRSRDLPRYVRLLHDLWRGRPCQQDLREGPLRRHGDDVLPIGTSGSC